MSPGVTGFRPRGRGGAGEEAVEAFTDGATSGDYDNVLRTVMEYVEVD